MINVVCAVDEAGISNGAMDVLVLPEGIRRESIVSASVKYPDAVIVGASSDGQYMRGHAFLRGDDLIDYLKIGTDGRSVGTRRNPNLAVFELPDFVLGILVCMDVDHEYRLVVKGALLESNRATKLLCVPADMGCQWFATPPVLGFPGISVAMSNGTMTYKGPNDRAKSVIAGHDGGWLARQVDTEAIAAIVA